MNKTFWLVSLLALLFSGCAVTHSPVVLGTVPPQSGKPTPIRDLAPSPTSVTVRGALVEKCPVAGCWFMLRDETGVIKVDTKAAGFVVTEVPLDTKVTVSGTLANTGERRITAAGLRY